MTEPVSFHAYKWFSVAFRNCVRCFYFQMLIKWYINFVGFYICGACCHVPCWHSSCSSVILASICCDTSHLFSSNLFSLYSSVLRISHWYAFCLLDALCLLSRRIYHILNGHSLKITIISVILLTFPALETHFDLIDTVDQYSVS